MITAEDLQAPPISCTDTRYGVVVRDRPILAADRVTFVGEPLAAVVAETRAIAKAAALEVAVEVTPEEAATTLDDALAPSSPLVHVEPFEVEDAVYASPLPLAYGESNTGLVFETARGEVERALARCARTFKASYRFPAVYQYAMEPFTVVADARRDLIHVWSSAQHPSYVARDLARLFAVDLGSVQVSVPYVGGGFGSKSFTHVEPLAVAMSRKVGRPVRLELDVAEAMTISRRHDAIAQVTSGVDGNGRIVAYDLDIAYNTGAYTLLGPYIVAKGAFRGLGGYDFEHYRVRARMVFTNTSPAGSMRAVGGPQAAFALESHLDEVALALERDPFELRRGLVASRGAEFRRGRTPMDADLTEDLTRLEGLAKDLAAPTLPHESLGTGVAMGVADPGASPVSSAVVRLASDGSLTVLVGSVEIGQGVSTVVRQIAAEALGVRFDRVAVRPTDTGYGPYDASTGASRSTSFSGLAVYRACRDIRARVAAAVCANWNCNPEQIRIDDGIVWAPDGRSWEMGECVRRHYGQNGGNFYGIGEVTAHEFPTTPAFWEAAGGVARVGVDKETGQIRLLGYASVADVGRVVNPLLLTGQEQGAIVQGLGHSLYESLEWEEGYPLTDSLLEYRVPRITDVPDDVLETFVENHGGPGPFGVKGAGEAGIIPVGAAIANAVTRALGVRVRELPLSPERVWLASRNSGRGD